MKTIDFSRMYNKGFLSKFIALAFMLFMVFSVFMQVNPTKAVGIPTYIHNDDSGDLNGLSISMTSGDDGSASVSVDGLTSGNTSDTWTTIFQKYKVVILGFSGIATLTFVLLFIKNFISLGANADNPAARRASITGCLWTGIATALCGSIMLVVGLFWNGLKD